jgi:hypothetical protein
MKFPALGSHTPLSPPRSLAVHCGRPVALTIPRERSDQLELNPDTESATFQISRERATLSWSGTRDFSLRPGFGPGGEDRGRAWASPAADPCRSYPALARAEPEQSPPAAGVCLRLSRL